MSRPSTNTWTPYKAVPDARRQSRRDLKSLRRNAKEHRRGFFRGLLTTHVQSHIF